MNVLITGCSSGIGKALSEVYLLNKFNVFGIDINDCFDENIKSFKCDITDEESLKVVKEYFEENKIKLDIIINVAGIHKMVSFVEGSCSDMKKVIDVNLTGVMNVNNVLYSILDKKGKVIIITSEVAGFDPLPFNGLYSVSKIALDAYGQGLRQELNLLGQKVITIRPGAIETPLSKGSTFDTKRLADETVLYEKQAGHFCKIAAKFAGKPMKPEKLAKFIYKVSLKKNPKYIYKKHQNLGLVLLNILPKRLQCFIIKLLLNRKVKKV